MSIHPDSSELLQAIPEVLEGVRVRVVAEGASGEPVDASATATEGSEQVRVDVPGGVIVADVPGGGALSGLVRALLGAIADRERLESDMESMNMSALRLLEQVAMMGETLPRLSAGGDDVEIAALGADACLRAAGVQRVVYAAGDIHKEHCDIVVDTGDVDGGVGGELDPLQPVQGFLSDVLQADGVVLRSVPPGTRIGEPGTIEHIARHQLLGVPVTYGAGDKRVTIGALVLVDRADPLVDEAIQAVQFGNEEGQVAESFAAMLGAVLGARKVAALGKELSMAKAIQQQILPDGPAVLDGFDVAAGYYACGAVGGDYYDYVPLADGRTMVVVADVSGHNLASGMVMVGARAMLRTLSTVHDCPAKVFSQVAARMHGDLTRTERFLTAAAVALSPAGHAVDYVSAGHNDLMIYRAATDMVERVATEDVILGFLPDPEYRVRRLSLAPGDCVLLYTDGITEAVNHADEMFGEDRLALLFAQLAANRSARRILAGIVRELEHYRRGVDVADDVTAVVIRRTEEDAKR